MKEIISTNKAPGAIGPYSQGIKIGNLLFTAGQIALDPETQRLKNNSINEEVHQIMSNLRGIAERAGTSFEHSVKTTIFMTNLSQFSKVNEIYGSYVGDKPPARSTIEVSALPAEASVEIEMIFHIPS